MNWTKWSSIAEILSSIAILATLVVLVFEVRSNTAEVRAASATTISGRTVDLIYESASNPLTTEMIAITAEGGEPTPAQLYVMNQYLAAILKIAEESFIAYRAGRLDEEVWLTRAEIALDFILSQETNGEAWISRRDTGWYVQDFVEWFDAEFAKRTEE